MVVFLTNVSYISSIVYTLAYDCGVTKQSPGEWRSSRLCHKTVNPNIPRAESAYLFGPLYADYPKVWPQPTESLATSTTKGKRLCLIQKFVLGLRKGH
jgi:hypothetical protein